MQITDVGVSLLGLPDWTGRLVFLLLAVGFPLVMTFSWVYEITPDGLKKESEVERNASITAETAQKLNTAVIVLLIIAVLGLAADRFFPENHDAPDATVAANAISEPSTAVATSEISDHSIAVLPFVNMSSDQENEYFSDGLSEELLNLLAKIPELQVAARTSAFSFKGKDVSIEEVAESLSVAHVLEGSVRKSGDEIRITAQLIKASNGFHLWSDTWDRTLDDVFAIQDEIAAAVVDSLRVELLGEVPHARVTDPRTYELYLQAKAQANLQTAESMTAAVQLLGEALEIDPEYAEGWLQLSTVYSNQAGSALVPETEGYTLARTAGLRALTIEPDNARALSGLAWIAMYADHNFDEATRMIRQAVASEPGNPSVLNTYGVLLGHFGKVDRQIGLYEEALTLDPRAMSVLWNLGLTYNNQGRHADAQRMVERMRAISPESFFVIVGDAFSHWFRGDSEFLYAAMQQRDDSISLLGLAIAAYDLGKDEEIGPIVERLLAREGNEVLVATIEAHRGDHERAFELLEIALEERDAEIIEVRGNVFLQPLHNDPRWEALLRRIGISDADAERLGL